MTMEHCDANDTPHKVEVGQVFLSQHTYTLVTVFHCNNSLLSSQKHIKSEFSILLLFVSWFTKLCCHLKKLCTVSYETWSQKKFTKHIF
jgi:hypothetical protein